MPRKSVRKIVEILKLDCEEWGGELQIDEMSLYRHVKEMLDLKRESSESAPAEIVEKYVKSIRAITITITNIADGETATGHRGTEQEIRIAANWAWTLFHDFFGEYPPTGDEEGYGWLLQVVLGVRRCDVIEQLPPLS
jgi:hypothetical protein